MNNDTTGASGRPKYRRSAIACKRCNERRVRCDASLYGTPCSNCRKHFCQQCELIQSKKIRGCSGRYIAARSAESVSMHQNLPVPGKEVGSCLAPRPESSPDARKLSYAERRDSQAPTASISAGISSPRESWYLELILELTNNSDFLFKSIDTQNTSIHDALINPIMNRNGDLQYNVDYQPEPETHILPFDALSPSLQSLLVNAYFDRFQSFCPIIDRASFLDQLRQGTVSRLLLRCVLFIGSVHCHMKTIYRMGFDTRREALKEMFRQAQLDFDSGYEKDVLTLLQCSFLLHYWWGQTLTFKDPTWWLAGAINAAKAMRLNRKSENGSSDESSRYLRRRIWWLLYVRDVQVSVSLGRPMSINDHDCDVEELTEDDFPHEPNDTALYVISQARLSLAASQILSAYFSPSSQHLISDPVGRQAAFGVIQSVISRWSSDVPQGMKYEDRRKSSLVLSLHMTKRYYQIIFHQKLQRACTDHDGESRSWDIILDAAGDITMLAEEIVIHWEPPLFPMTCVSAIFISMTVQYLRLQSADKMQNIILKRSLRSNFLSLKQFEQCYSLASWICNLFGNVVSKLEGNYRTTVQPQHQTSQPQITPRISDTSPKLASPDTYLSPGTSQSTSEQSNWNEVFSISGLFDGDILQEIGSAHMSHLDFLDLSDIQN
ncbi:fungal-specific transcription factor domain-containing protein [Xylogone sp. PMI_703]|nr:fungal-specific transcription factor domain-containing protein [Xylogone sp. PMI_703]